MDCVSSVILISLTVVIVVVTATDFCAPNLCPPGQEHIGCRNNGGLAPACPAGRTQIVPMTNDLKAAILHSHNCKRNTIAGGKLRDFKPATRMATMRWDDELALLASYNVKRCHFAHDQCHNTDAFKHSGQNLATSKAGSFNETDSILRYINRWWNEYKDTKVSDIERFPRPPKKKIGHFTVMTAEKNVAVGCAAIRYPKGRLNTLTMACNYAATNISNRPLYISGPTASKCTTGMDSRYPALCSKSEKYS